MIEMNKSTDTIKPAVLLLVLMCVSPGLALAQDSVPQNISLTRIEGRHWLVGPDGQPFFGHGITHVGTTRATFDLGEISRACRRVGFNAYGYGCPEALRADMPYVESWNHLAPISTYRGAANIDFVDVFDPQEKARLEKGVRVNCERSLKNPRHIIGYCWTDLGAWPLDNPTGKNWVDFIRNLPDDKPGRKAYEAFLETWDGNDTQARDQAFLQQIAREYFRVVGTANKKYSPQHLIFGDRFAFNTFDQGVIREMLPYVDAIAIQPPFQSPFPKAKLDEIYRFTGKPILICDFAVRFRDGDKDIRSWKPAEDSRAAGKAYYEYVKQAINTEYVLGVFWCNPVDTTKGFGKPGVKQGFFGDGLSERPGLYNAVRQLNDYRESKTPKR